MLCLRVRNANTFRKLWRKMGGRASRKEIHVLVVPFHVQGHINPMLQFAKRLSSKGLRLTLVIPKSIGNSIQSHGNSINVEFIFDGVKEGQSTPAIEEYLKIYKAAATQSIAELLEKHSSTPHPIKYIIYDSIVPWLLDVARSSGIDGCPFFTQSCAVGAVYYHAFQGTLNFPFEEPVVSLPSIPPLEFNDLPSFVRDSGSYPGIYDMVFSQFSNVNEPGVLLWNTFTELEDKVRLKFL
uniref:Glycosyltransferase n=1 Tax=Rhizophora mucronata TaxID=61149 RepID=A0A2P2JGU8_RHIMU